MGIPAIAERSLSLPRVSKHQIGQGVSRISPVETEDPTSAAIVEPITAELFDIDSEFEGVTAPRPCQISHQLVCIVGAVCRSIGFADGVVSVYGDRGVTEIQRVGGRSFDP